MVRFFSKFFTLSVLIKLISFLLTILVCSIVIVFVYDELCILTTDEMTLSLTPEGRRLLGDEYVRFLDVGQGDSALAVSGGESLLIDTGTPENARKLCAELKTLGINRIDTLLITHFHNDHMGAISLLCRRFQIKRLVIPEVETSSESGNAAEVLRCAEEIFCNGGSVENVADVQTFGIGDISLEVLFYDGDSDSENNRSVISRLEVKKKKFLLMGDALKTCEEKLLRSRSTVECDVLKVGHHGAKNASCSSFLCAASPEYSVISCGLDNIYSHPDFKTLKRLETVNSKIYRTDMLGSITFFVEDDSLIVKTENN